jgi:hypothetical protein
MIARMKVTRTCRRFIPRFAHVAAFAAAAIVLCLALVELARWLSAP